MPKIIAKTKPRIKAKIDKIIINRRIIFPKNPLLLVIIVFNKSI
ncbi:MAG: hypothetical protein ABIL89_03030 [candidate division WOR-3 bacterium]